MMREDLPGMASKVHSVAAMEMTKYRVRPLVNAWMVEAEGGNVPSTQWESKEEAMHVAHARARGTAHQIVVLDEQGKVESVFPPANPDIDGA